MASSQLQVSEISAENLGDPSDSLTEGTFAALEASLSTRKNSHLDSALPPGLARRVVAKVVSTTRPVRSRLTVESKRESISLDVSLRLEKAASGFRLVTADPKEIDLVLEIDANEHATLKFNTNYVGLETRKALQLARFWCALFGREGTLYLGRLGPGEEKFELARLPLPGDLSVKKAEEDRIRLLEALNEVSEATGASFVYPSSLEDEALRSLNRILRIIRGGWIALPVTDFTTPMNQEGVRNVLDLTTEGEETLKNLVTTAEWERSILFDTRVDLGPSIRYVSGPRLATPRSDIEEWLASNPGPADSFDIRWVPANGSWVHVFYQDWPKPSLQAVREDIRVFEEELGKDSDEFRRAWEDGESWAREIPDGDIWLTLLDAEHYLEQQT